jgi:uncharacterized protein (TIGR02246 family)
LDLSIETRPLLNSPVHENVIGSYKTGVRREVLDSRTSVPERQYDATMTYNLLALALVASLMSGCASPAPASADTAADQAALTEITATWFKAYNGGDADTAAELYAEEAVLMPPHAPVARGRAAIRAFIAKDSADAKSAGLTLVNGTETAGVNGDWGWNSGSYTVQDASGKSVDSGSYLSVSHKVSGKWLYVRDTYNSDQPLPTPPAK